MKAPRHLLIKVIKKSTTFSQVIEEVRSLAPASARFNPLHSWWKVEAQELLDDLSRADSGTFYLTAREAVLEARELFGKVVSQKISGLRVFQVLPAKEAEALVIENLICEAMPSSWVEPTWSEELPTLDRFRALAEKRYLERLLDKNDFNIVKASREAGIARQTLYALIERHSLQRPGDQGSKTQDQDLTTSSELEISNLERIPA